MDFHNGLKKDLPVVGGLGETEKEKQDELKLKRQDTDTLSVDEFVDAEG